MKKLFNLAVLPLIISGLVLLGWWLLKDARIDVLEPHGEVAAHQKQLLFFTVALSALVVLPVFTMLAVFGIKYRASNKKAAYRPDWEKNTLLETIWWGIPIIIIAVLAVVTWQTSHSLDPYRKIASDTQPIKVQVVALEWKWLFLYPDLGVASINHLPVPVNTPIEFTLTADAPMSAFWVPSLGSQIYAMNGMSSQLNLIANHPGSFDGYTTNINGRGYSDMTFTVHARSPQQFNDWVSSTQASPETMDINMYKKVAKPSVKKGEFSYQLTDPDLYDTIVGKYMGHSSQNTIPASTLDGAHDNMEDM